MEDYKKRMITEYRELKERCEKLQRLIHKAETGKIDFELNCPIYLLYAQLSAMLKYLRILKERATYYENIKL